MNENINLCKLLKGHEGETFYSPIFGNIKLSIISEEESGISFDNCRFFYSNGKYNSQGECLIFPSKEQRDWNKWAEEQKPKVPKTWSDIKECDVNFYQVISSLDYDSVNPIIIAADALLKIHQLIEVGYGGNITIEEWDNDNLPKYCLCCYVDSIIKDTYRKAHSHIAFHTKEQRDEFWSYPENVQLVKDFYMI